MGFWFYAFSFFFLFFFCWLISLIQSQSLSRRTTPFPPRVQVMGPVCRAQTIWYLLIDCRLAFFCFHTLKMHSGGSCSSEFPSQCSALCHFSSVWFLGIAVMRRVIMTRFNPFTLWFLDSACSTNLTPLKRHSSIARFDTRLKWSLCYTCSSFGNAGGCLAEILWDKRLQFSFQCDMKPRTQTLTPHLSTGGDSLC